MCFRTGLASSVESVKRTCAWRDYVYRLYEKKKKMGWIYLVLGGLFEMGWPVGMKLAGTHAGWRWVYLGVAVASMALSGYFLYMAQRTIPIGTAYAAWTGIGAVGTLLIGIFFFHDPAGFWRLFSAFLIVAGIVGLKLAS